MSLPVTLGFIVVTVLVMWWWAGGSKKSTLLEQAEEALKEGKTIRAEMMGGRAVAAAEKDHGERSIEVARVRYAFAQILAKAGESERAIEEFTAASEIDNGAEEFAEQRTGFAHMLVQIAFQHLRKGDKQNGTAQLELAAKLLPADDQMSGVVAAHLRAAKTGAPYPFEQSEKRIGKALTRYVKARTPKGLINAVQASMSVNGGFEFGVNFAREPDDADQLAYADAMKAAIELIENGGIETLEKAARARD